MKGRAVRFIELWAQGLFWVVVVFVLIAFTFFLGAAAFVVTMAGLQQIGVIQ